MKDLKVIIIALCLLGSPKMLQAQNTFSASGGNAIGQGGSVSYTIGQVVYLNISGTGGDILQGIQQPFEVTVITGSEDPEIQIGWSVYPNPAGEFITLMTGGYDFEKLHYQFYDINGNLLLKEKLSGDQAWITTGNFKAGTYFLVVSDNIKNLKTFKIIKK